MDKNKKAANQFDLDVEKIKAEIFERQRLEEERRTLHPIKVQECNYTLAGPTYGHANNLTHRFSDIMQEAERGKCKVSGYLVVTREKENIVDVVNFIAAATKRGGSSWTEDRVQFKDNRDTHTFRIQAEEKMGCEFAVDEGHDYSEGQPNTFTVYQGFKRYSEIVARLIPSEQDEDEFNKPIK